MGLTGENRDLAGQVREGQEKLRLSASHVQQLVSQIEDFRRRAVAFESKEKDFARNQQELEKRLNELGLRYETTQRDNQGLAGQVRDAQEKLRLSATETSRLGNELNDFKNRILGLTGENKDLAGQVR